MTEGDLCVVCSAPVKCVTIVAWSHIRITNEGLLAGLPVGTVMPMSTDVQESVNYRPTVIHI